MNVLVVAPHPDDEAIGCGGTIVRHSDAGDHVAIAFLTSGELSDEGRPAAEVKATREREAQAAAEVLGVTDFTFLRRPDWFLGEDVKTACGALAAIVRSTAPDRVYVPHAHEWHPDHRAAFKITSRVAEELCAEVLAYEVWTPLRTYTVVEDTTEQMARKLEAISCYSSQLQAFDYLRAASGLNSFRGALAAKTAYAEVFDDASFAHV